MSARRGNRSRYRDIIELQKQDDRFRELHNILKKPAQIINDFGLNFVPQPFSKRLNLKVGVSEVLFNQTQLDSLVLSGSWASTYVSVHRMIFDLEFLDNTLDFSNFGDQSALSNGVEIRYTFGDTEINLITSGGGILANKDFLEIAYDTNINTDGGATKLNIFTTRFSLKRFAHDGIMLDLGRGDKITFDVKDNLTASPTYDNILDFSVRVQGEAYLLG